ncbi:MAG: DUF4468 domain-containing protein [Mucilaginibacter sp.]
MKRIFLVLMCLFAARVASAQKDLLSFNEQNKYIYYQVVEQPGLTTDTLQARALYFLKTDYPQNKVEKAAASGNFTGSGKFLIASTLSVIKHIYGEVSYTYFIECKDGKYRYWLTDFVYTPHKTDRYGNSVPEQGMEMPLENGAKKLDKHDLVLSLDETGTYCKQFGEKLKRAMVKISALAPKEARKKVIMTKDW